MHSLDGGAVQNNNSLSNNLRERLTVIWAAPFGMASHEKLFHPISPGIVFPFIRRVFVCDVHQLPLPLTARKKKVPRICNIMTELKDA